MTVVELLERIQAAYAGATPAAMETFTPIFYARLRRFEGEALEAAATEVLGSFKPRFDQKFPIPLDFEAQLPASHPKMADESHLRAELEARATRRHVNIQKWMEGQGLKIRAARAPLVYAACLMMAMELCQRSSWHFLTPAQIEECDMRAVSQARVRMFGPKLPPTNEAWDEQIARVRASWAQPVEKAA